MPSHRLSTITAADQILCLHAGRVVEAGTHEELLAMKGRYASMWKKQIRAEPAAEETGGWIAFGDCDFGPGYATVTARVAGPASRLVLRADDPVDGAVLATVDTPDTGGVYDYTEATADLVGAEGIATLYVTFAGGARLASLTFGEAGR